MRTPRLYMCTIHCYDGEVRSIICSKYAFEQWFKTRDFFGSPIANITIGVNPIPR